MRKCLTIIPLILWTVNGDECESICSLIPGACSSKGSYCKNGHACMDMFWFTDNAVICNSSNEVWTGRREVLCSQARSIVSGGNRAGIVSFVNMGSSTVASRAPVVSTTVQPSSATPEPTTSTQRVSSATAASAASTAPTTAGLLQMTLADAEATAGTRSFHVVHILPLPRVASLCSENLL